MGLSIAVTANVPTVVVDTDAGKVQGYLEDGVNHFLGIPFAKPPVGDLRFRSPEPVMPWKDVKQVTSYGHSCYQGLLLGNEDCLHLDVYVPETLPGTKPLPVMFWIYGGGFVNGDKYEYSLYDPKSLMEDKRVIVVAVNYRLGPLGFLALDELKEEDPLNSTGNAGMFDQVAGLKWVQNNIANFGGDPARVTIFGESAGAMSVCWHLGSAHSKNLFSGAIMESGTCDAIQFFKNYTNAVSFSRFFADTHGCKDKTLSSLLICLRKMPLRDMTEWFDQNFTGYFRPKLFPVMPWGPVVDGSALVDTPIALMTKGEFNNVPLIIGTNLDEGTIFIPSITKIVPGVHFPMSDAEFAQVMLFFFETADNVNKITPLYPKSNYGNQAGRLAHIIRDYIFVCGSRRAARAITKQKGSVYVYQYKYKKGWIERFPTGDFHASDLLMVWDNYMILHDNKEDKDMSASFQYYWKNLAVYRSPNPTNQTFPSDIIEWPVSGCGDNSTNMVLNVPL